MGLGQRWLDAAYRGSPWLTLLRPLELLYRREVERRAKAYRQGSRPGLASVRTGHRRG